MNDIENSMVLPTATPAEYDDAVPGIDDLDEAIYDELRQREVDDNTDFEIDNELRKAIHILATQNSYDREDLLALLKRVRARIGYVPIMLRTQAG